MTAPAEEHLPHRLTAGDEIGDSENWKQLKKDVVDQSDYEITTLKSFTTYYRSINRIILKLCEAIMKN